MNDLILPVKRVYFEQMRDGSKTEEFRLVTPFWTRRLAGRTYARLIITLGYPKKGDPARTLVFPWRGCRTRTLTHPHFGDQPVMVYAIAAHHGIEPGEACGRHDCEGIIYLPHPENCSCYLGGAPCGSCMDVVPTCDACDWRDQRP